MIEVQYLRREGSHVRGPIRPIAERIEALKRRHLSPEYPEGHVSPEEVVADARAPDSPLHPLIIWDDGEAAHQFRLHQARRLMNCYEVHIIRRNGEPIVISPANVCFDHRPRGASLYTSPTAAMAEPDTRDRVLHETVAALGGFERRLALLQGVSPAIIRVVGTLRAMIEREMKKAGAPKARRRAAVPGGRAP